MPELVDVVVGLLDKGFYYGVVLSHLGGEIFLTLEQSGDVALQLDEFAGDGFGGARADKAAAQCAGENGGAEDGDVADTHEKVLLKSQTGCSLMIQAGGDDC